MDQPAKHYEERYEAGDIDYQSRQCIEPDHLVSVNGLRDRSMIGLPFVVHQTASVESGDCTFMRTVRQDG